MQERATALLIEMGVEVMKGELPESFDATAPRLEPGRVNLSENVAADGDKETTQGLRAALAAAVAAERGAKAEVSRLQEESGVTASVGDERGAEIEAAKAKARQCTSAVEMARAAVEADRLAAEELGTISFDVYLPTFAQGPNTTFLAGSGVLSADGWVETTSCLQSKAAPEIFAAGVSTMPLLGHPVSARLISQAATCAHNAKLFLAGKTPTQLKPHADYSVPPVMDRPAAVKLGLGKGGYAIWDAQPVCDPPGLLMCGPCGGGYPLCPPPCCWCAPGCSTCCGQCNGPRESEGLAVFFESTLLPFTMREKLLGAKVGDLPPEAMEMTRQYDGRLPL
jgi:hypothetical protein